MTTRLIALVMLPVTALCLLAGSVVVSHRSLATNAGDVENGVTGLSQLVALADSLSDQKAIEAFDARFEQLGVTRAIASSYLGFDLTGEVAPARAQADLAVASLGSVSPVDANALRSLYADIDAGVISPTVALERLAGFIAVSDNAVASGLERLEAKVDHPELMAAQESLRTASGLHRFAIPQVVDLSAIWFPRPGTPR